jgi:hypothetical protein
MTVFGLKVVFVISCYLLPYQYYLSRHASLSFYLVQYVMNDSVVCCVQGVIVSANYGVQSS